MIATARTQGPEQGHELSHLAQTLMPRTIEVLVALASEYSPITARELLDNHPVSSYTDVAALLRELELQGLTSRSQAPTDGSGGARLTLWRATTLGRAVGDQLIDVPSSDELHVRLSATRRRTGGKRARPPAAAPIALDELRAILPPRRKNAPPRDLRDRAILLTSFSGALNRAEASKLRFGQIEIRKARMVIKVAPTRKRPARRIPILRLDSLEWCPVTAIIDWRRAAGPTGPIWRRLYHPDDGITDSQASELALGMTFRDRLNAAGQPQTAALDFRSLREGMAAHAAQAGWSRDEIWTVIGYDQRLLDAHSPVDLEPTPDPTGFARRID